MDNTQWHPLVKLTHQGCRLVAEDDAPQFRAQLRPSQVGTLERLLCWLDAVQRDRRLSLSTLLEHKRSVDALCQDIYERGGRP